METDDVMRVRIIHEFIYSEKKMFWNQHFDFRFQNETKDVTDDCDTKEGDKEDGDESLPRDTDEEEAEDDVDNRKCKNLLFIYCL